MNFTNKREVREHVRNLLQVYVEDGTVDTDEMRALVKNTCDELSLPISVANLECSALQSLMVFLSAQNVPSPVLERVQSRLHGLEDSQHEQHRDNVSAARAAPWTSADRSASIACAPANIVRNQSKPHAPSPLSSSEFGLAALRERMAKKREELKAVRDHVQSSVTASNVDSNTSGGSGGVDSVARASVHTTQLRDDGYSDANVDNNITQTQQNSFDKSCPDQEAHSNAMDRDDRPQEIDRHAMRVAEKATSMQSATVAPLELVTASTVANNDVTTASIDAAPGNRLQASRHDKVCSREVNETADSITVTAESTAASTETRLKRKKKRSETFDKPIMLSAGPLVEDDLYDDLPPVRHERAADYSYEYGEPNAYAQGYYDAPNNQQSCADAVPPGTMYWQNYSADPTMPVNHAQYGADHGGMHYPPQGYYDPSYNPYPSY